MIGNILDFFKMWWSDDEGQFVIIYDDETVVQAYVSDAYIDATEYGSDLSEEDLYIEVDDLKVMDNRFDSLT